MNDESQTQLAEAKKMLAEAHSLSVAGQHGAAMKRAYEASEFIAARYLSCAAGKKLPPSDAIYEGFAKTIRAQDYNPAVLAKVKEVVGKVSVLREIYEPALLDETTAKDTQQMIGCVSSLAELVEEALRLR